MAADDPPIGFNMTPEQFAALLASAGRPAPSPIITVKKWNGQDTYSYTIKQFMSLCKEYFAMANIKEEHKLMFACSFLDGVARTWWETVRDSANEPADFGALIGALNMQFPLHDEDFMGREKADKAVCRGSVMAHVSAMLGHFAHIENLSERSRTFLLQKGLPENIRVLIGTSTACDWTSWGTTIELACKFEAHLAKMPAAKVLYVSTAERNKTKYTVRDPTDADSNKALQKMDDKEKKRCLEAKLCFRCRKPDHQSWETSKCSAHQSNKSKGALHVASSKVSNAGATTSGRRSAATDSDDTDSGTEEGS
jgi:hypothetical protein